jgi:hypothetical protein
MSCCARVGQPLVSVILRMELRALPLVPLSQITSPQLLTSNL